MRRDAEASGPRWAETDDARVTRVGRLLRRARIDELPQFLNVLAGQMSLVGPRPERPEFVATLEEAIPFYRVRLIVRPGLTGWAQVNRPYGSSVEDARAKLEFDLFYIRHRSIWFDLRVLLKTLLTVARLGGR
jgi:lipopolysaccharide/colanic/teichoic acid biosynthesis glycosyltransferase